MVDAGAWVRAVRRQRRWSQRELAGRSGIPQQTVSRVESGAAGPQLTTFVRLMAAAGFGLVLVDYKGRALLVDEEHDRVRDAAGRHLPAHLLWRGKPDYFDRQYWWGWHRIAWIDSDVPEYIWYLRPRAPAQIYWGSRGLELGYVWDDAT